MMFFRGPQLYHALTLYVTSLNGSVVFKTAVMYGIESVDSFELSSDSFTGVPSRLKIVAAPVIGSNVAGNPAAPALYLIAAARQ